MSPTPHGEAARRVQAALDKNDGLAGVYGFDADVINMYTDNLRTLLEEHGEMAAMLEDSLSGLEYIARRYGPLDGVGWDRINAYRAKLAGEGGEAEKAPEPAKLPAAPKVEVGQVWLDSNGSLFRIIEICGTQAKAIRNDSVLVADLSIPYTLANRTLVSSPTDASDALDALENEK